MGSRLSNISTIVELLGEVTMTSFILYHMSQGGSQKGSPARNGSAMSEDSRTK